MLFNINGKLVECPDPPKIKCDFCHQELQIVKTKARGNYSYSVNGEVYNFVVVVRYKHQWLSWWQRNFSEHDSGKIFAYDSSYPSLSWHWASIYENF